MSALSTRKKEIEELAEFNLNHFDVSRAVATLVFVHSLLYGHAIYAKMMWRRLRVAYPFVFGSLLTYALYVVASQTEHRIAMWAPVCVAAWFLHAALMGWARLSKWDYIGAYWGTISAYNFICYLRYDTEFEGWGDVYFFCGHQHQYCTCQFHWNLLGWWKAFAIWNFSIAFAFGLQKLALLLGLGGLLPGEEVVTKDSVVSVCWRLVPYWLNNWEQNWGTECSSMLFEVPRFAMELLVILPCVQVCTHVILCTRCVTRCLHPDCGFATQDPCGAADSCGGARGSGRRFET